MNKNAIIGAAITGISAGLSFLAARLTFGESVEWGPVCVGAFIMAAMAFLSQMNPNPPADAPGTVKGPQSAQDSTLKGNDKAEACIILGIKWR